MTRGSYGMTGPLEPPVPADETEATTNVVPPGPDDVPPSVQTVAEALGPWRILGASVIGNDHIRGGLPRQDGLRVVLVADWVVLAVADGAGSARASDQGAQVALDAATEQAAMLLSDEEYSLLPVEQLLARVFAWAGKRVMEHAAAARRPTRDFDTTLAVALIGPTLAGFGQVGDAIIAVETVEGDVEGVAVGDRGEYVNETYFITRDRELSQLSTASRFTSGLRGVVLSTDGLERVAVQRRAPYEPFFQSVLRFAEAPEASAAAVADFLMSVEDRKGDDKTLLIATRSAGGQDATAGGEV
jgi:hypothetical protein